MDNTRQMASRGERWGSRAHGWFLCGPTQVISLVCRPSVSLIVAQAKHCLWLAREQILSFLGVPCKPPQVLQWRRHGNKNKNKITLVASDSKKKVIMMCRTRTRNKEIFFVPLPIPLPPSSIPWPWPALCVRERELAPQWVSPHAWSFFAKCNQCKAGSATAASFCLGYNPQDDAAMPPCRVCVCVCVSV
jgi:hypothetical protein